ncbi:hypothetical protein [Phenylobacterium aquaticum]|uniref:hypothetical protein n=1 Tax=Phenylobacterium aquaticum TaxID=1763816 RepID=UPI0026EAAAD3|nr:hypothetical protein [Phenylobacterium aquaticum]
MLQKVLGPLFRFMPFLFGIGFLGPVIAESLVALHQPAPFGVPALYLGLAVGGGWGAFANWSGRWI